MRCKAARPPAWAPLLHFGQKSAFCRGRRLGPCQDQRRTLSPHKVVSCVSSSSIVNIPSGFVWHGSQSRLGPFFRRQAVSKFTFQEGRSERKIYAVFTFCNACTSKMTCNPIAKEIFLIANILFAFIPFPAYSLTPRDLQQLFQKNANNHSKKHTKYFRIPMRTGNLDKSCFRCVQPSTWAPNGLPWRLSEETQTHLQNFHFCKNVGGHLVSYVLRVWIMLAPFRIFFNSNPCRIVVTTVRGCA